MGFLSTIVGGITSIFGGSNKRKSEEAVARANAEKHKADQLAAQVRIAEANAKAKAAAATANNASSSGGMGKNMPYILGAAGLVLAVMLSKKK